MGMLIKGQWSTQWYDTKSTDGEFVRQDAQFRSSIIEAAAEDGNAFVAESGRYHLFVSLACPWAHRTLIFRKLKDLEAHIGVTIVKAEMYDNGWELSDLADASPVSDIDFLYQLYTTAKADYSGRVTVPVLWDKHTRTIVSNESSEIIRFFNSAFNGLTGNQADYYPATLRKDIDAINSLVYDNINNGVYRAGFATTQHAYEAAFDRLFAALDKVDALLGTQRYLVGDRITEADWRLFTTLIRFDSVYVGHFKTNLRTIESYDNISHYVRELYQTAGVAETVNFEHIKDHYYKSHTMINPTQVVPKGPAIDYNRPHNRASLLASHDEKEGALS